MRTPNIESYQARADRDYNLRSLPSIQKNESESCFIQGE